MCPHTDDHLCTMTRKARGRERKWKKQTLSGQEKGQLSFSSLEERTETSEQKLPSGCVEAKQPGRAVTARSPCPPPRSSCPPWTPDTSLPKFQAKEGFVCPSFPQAMPFVARAGR